MQMQLTPVQQQAQLLAAKERERADDSRFASNLVYSRSTDSRQQPQDQMVSAQYGPAERQVNSNLVPPTAEGKQETRPEDINAHWSQCRFGRRTALSRFRGFGSRHGSHESPGRRRRRTGQSPCLKSVVFARSSNTSSFPRERLFWARQRRLERRASANSAGWPWFFTADYAGRLLRRSRPVPGPRSNWRGRAQG